MADQQRGGAEVDLAFCDEGEVHLYLYDRPERGRQITAFLKDHGFKIGGVNLGGAEPLETGLFAEANGDSELASRESRGSERLAIESYLDSDASSCA